MAEFNLVEAINKALHDAMAEDENHYAKGFAKESSGQDVIAAEDVCEYARFFAHVHAPRAPVRAHHTWAH